PLAEATALNFTSTIFATIGAAAVLHERVRLHRWVAVIVGFVGVLVILQPGSGVASIGGFLVLIASVLWAGALLIAKELTRHESNLGIVAGMAALSALLSFPAALIVWKTPSISETALLLL